MEIGFLLTSNAKKKLLQLYENNREKISDSCEFIELENMVENSCYSIEGLKKIINQLVIDDIQREIAFCDVIKECYFSTDDQFETKMQPSHLLASSLEFQDNPSQIDETPVKYRSDYIRRVKEKTEKYKYDQLIKNTDSRNRSRNPVYDSDNFKVEMANISKQIWSLIGFLTTLLGTFVFGYFGSIVAFESEPMRAMVGVLLMTTVLFAEIYYIMKTDRF